MSSSQDTVLEKDRPFMKSLLVIDVSFLVDFLDKTTVQMATDPSGQSIQQYVKWSTSHNYSPESRTLSALLVSKGVPRNTNCLLKMY